MLTLSQGGDRFWCQQIYRSLIFYFIPQSKDKPCWGSTPDAPQRVHPGSLLPVFSVVSARYPSAPVYEYLPEVPVHWDRPRNRCRWNSGYTPWHAPLPDRGHARHEPPRRGWCRSDSRCRQSHGHGGHDGSLLPCNAAWHGWHYNESQSGRKAKVFQLIVI